MGFDRPVTGQVESFGRGIAVSNASSGAQGLPGVEPVYICVRLAQRVPVRVRIADVHAGVLLAAGLTTTVRIERPGADGHDIAPAFEDQLRRTLDVLHLQPAERRSCALPYNGPTAPVSRLPFDDGEALLPTAKAEGPKALPMGETAQRTRVVRTDGPSRR